MRVNEQSSLKVVAASLPRDINMLRAMSYVPRKHT